MNKVMRKDTIVYRFIDDFYLAYEKFKSCHTHKVGAFADEIWLLVRNLHNRIHEIDKQEDSENIYERRTKVIQETNDLLRKYLDTLNEEKQA